MKSIRLDPELQERLERAAVAAGETLSQFIRRAAAERAAAVLENDQERGWDDVIGVVHGGGGRARRSGAAFTEAISPARSRR